MYLYKGCSVRKLCTILFVRLFKSCMIICPEFYVFRKTLAYALTHTNRWNNILNQTKPAKRKTRVTTNIFSTMNLTLCFLRFSFPPPFKHIWWWWFLLKKESFFSRFLYFFRLEIIYNCGMMVLHNINISFIIT